MILGVKKQTSNIACRAEMGRFPLHLEMYVSMIKYWLRLNKTPRNKITADALKDNLFMQESGLYTWTSMIQSILEDTNYSEVWTNKGTPNETKLIKDLSKNKLRTYRTFKLDHKQELYLTHIKDTHIRSSVAKMRLSNHHLMIEKGRHMGLDLDKRICIMLCPANQNERNILFDLLTKEIYGWHNINTEERFIEIMKIEKQPIQTGIFWHHIMHWEPPFKSTYNEWNPLSRWCLLMKYTI